MSRRRAGLVVAVAVCLAAQVVAGLFTAPGVSSWYGELDKPSWTPPGWIFGPVWTALYLTMAVSAWRVWSRGGEGSRGALVLFAVQLAFNVAWSGIFFGLRMPGAAFLEICLLWLLVLATLVSFAGRDRMAGRLLLPYLAWVTFAAALNFAIWRLNAA